MCMSVCRFDKLPCALPVTICHKKLGRARFLTIFGFVFGCVVGCLDGAAERSDLSVRVLFCRTLNSAWSPSAGYISFLLMWAVFCTRVRDEQ